MPLFLGGVTNTTRFRKTPLVMLTAVALTLALNGNVVFAATPRELPEASAENQIISEYYEINTISR